MKTIGVVTVGRSDYGILRPVLKAIQDHHDLTARLFVTGAHFLEAHGRTVQDIDADAWPDRIDLPVEYPAGDSPAAAGEVMARITSVMAGALNRHPVDLLVLLGDRYEMLAAASAAVPAALPLAHIHGGEISAGAIDNAIRDALTKLSHLHFCSLPAYADRIIRMGEEPWRVTISGAPGLDNLKNFQPAQHDELARVTGLDFNQPVILCAFHPVTLEPGQAEAQTSELVTALLDTGLQVLFTLPNADPGNADVRKVILETTSRVRRMRAAPNLGTRLFYSVLSRAAVMAGNSSSGIIEAASFRLPVVNTGNRQAGRICGKNVIHCGSRRHDIREALQNALDPAFRKTLADLVNPYGDGNAAGRIATRLAEPLLRAKLLAKAIFQENT